MQDESGNTDRTILSRRQLLTGIGGSVAAASLSRNATADGEWINVVDVGADPTGEESISPVLDALTTEDGTTFYFPEGEYLMDDMFRNAGFNGFELRGDDATIVPAPDYDGRWLFKLGTYEEPGEDLYIEGLTFDFSADETGLRVVQAQVKDDLLVQDLAVSGRHDSGKYGPFCFDVTHPDGIGSIENVRLPDGGEFSENTPGDINVGPTGIIVSQYHEGKLWVRNCDVGPWPDNGLYCSTEKGRVVVKGGLFKNSNIASIRLSGDYSSIHDATVIVDNQRDNDINQRAIRLDGGAYNWVENTDVYLKQPNGRAISIQNDVKWARIQDCRVVVEDGEPTRAICVSPQTGKVDILNTEVEFDAPGQALHIQGPSSADADPVYVLKTTITGSGDGSHGRHAVRAERGNCLFDRLDVEQTGDDYRRGIKILGDGCTLKWGDYNTTHIPIVNDADETTFHGVTARSLDDDEGMKILDGSSGVELVESTIHNGIWEDGEVSVTYDGNWYP
ncbi:pectate lyase family protein [Haloferax larsenii]|uniref:Pectate lyase superfamily protein n=1 Tax=Haloferax larsenii TaxID=302484 RepID=A0A1H7V2A8_HALLR|nr:glycosyl hydrolase family 28-related protein [Haloferax larsenii]SEM03391.1 Pectate lyase superfamily protein [Haloferax larsenii]